MTSAAAAVDNLDVRPVQGRDGVLVVAFDSELLGRRTESMAWLPPDDVPGPWPVTYYLHGTVGTTYGARVERWAERRHQRNLPLHPMLAQSRRRAVTPDTMGLADSRLHHRFLVVAPDAGERAWCGVCNWIDGRQSEDGTVRGVLAERHLYEELIPVVQELFTTRIDRAGRAIIGHSMGGGGAMIQGFRHPDRFTFVGSSSGTLTVLDDWMSRSGVRWAYYNRTQGLRPIPLDRVAYENHNLLDLAPNVRGIDIELVAVIGDGELHEDTAESTYEGSLQWFVGDPDRRREQTTMEQMQRRNNDLVVPRLLEAGVELDYITREGIHEIGPSTFRRHFLPRLHDRFEGPPPTEPDGFTHRSADAAFTAFGYRVQVQRREPGFVTLCNAARDGSRVMLTGDGVVELVLPVARGARQVEVCQPGRDARVKTLRDTGDGMAVGIHLDARRHTIGGPGRLQRPGELDIATIRVVP